MTTALADLTPPAALSGARSRPVPSRARAGHAGFVVVSLGLHAALFALLWGTGVVRPAPEPAPSEIACNLPPEDDRPSPAEPMEPPEKPVVPPLVPAPADAVPEEPVPAEEVTAELPALPELAAVGEPSVHVDVTLGVPRTRQRVLPATVPVPAASPPPPVSPAPVVARRPGGVVVRPLPDPMNRPPAFPADALARGERGSVVLRITVGEDGSVADVVVEQSSGSASLDRAALEAVSLWRFRPAMRDGVPVAASLRQPVRFS